MIVTVFVFDSAARNQFRLPFCKIKSTAISITQSPDDHKVRYTREEIKRNKTEE
jgi:hypothetical protein